MTVASNRPNDVESKRMVVVPLIQKVTYLCTANILTVKIKGFTCVPFPIVSSLTVFLAVKNCKNCKTCIFYNSKLCQNDSKSTVGKRTKVKSGYEI